MQTDASIQKVKEALKILKKYPHERDRIKNKLLCLFPQKAVFSKSLPRRNLRNA